MSPTTPTTTLGRLLEERGISLRAFGDYIDVSHTWAAKLAAGTAPLSRDRAEVAARALKVGSNDLYRKHAAEHDFVALELSLKALDDLGASEVLASRRGQRLVAKLAERLEDLARNEDLDPALKARAEEAAGTFAEAVTKATSDARDLVVTKRREVDDAATKAAADGDDDGRPYRDSFGRVRHAAKHERDGFGRAKRSDSHVPSHKRSSVPRSTEVISEAADSMKALGRDRYGRVIKEETTEDGASGFSQRGRRSQRDREAKRQAEQLAAEAESASRAEKNYVKGSVDWARSEIEKQRGLFVWSDGPRRGSSRAG